MTQQGDPLLFNTANGGNISYVNGLVEMSSGLENAAYLSLFGGNQRDAGGDNKKFTWWGNIDTDEVNQEYRSETQHLIDSLPATSENLLRVESAAGRDLAWMIDAGVASSITVTASIPTLNIILIVVDIVAFGEESSFTFSKNWKAATT